MSGYIIETKQLTKKYDDRISVDCVNLHVSEGKIYGLSGQNGAGKTTIMKMLLKLIKPTSGQIKLFGEDIESSDEKLYHRIGSIIEAPAFYENLTAAENLKILARLRGQHRKDTVENALSVAGLIKEQNKLFKDYSLGMKQRLGIAAAIMHEPELLILDEPMNGLDPVGICEIRQFLLRLCREKQTTILLSGHILSEMEQLADTIGIMRNGKLIEEIDMADLHRQNRKYIEFEVSDVNAAVLILERNFHLFDYMITNDRQLRIFHETEKRSDINRCFIKNDISVISMTVREEKLEDHFKNAIENLREERYGRHNE